MPDARSEFATGGLLTSWGNRYGEQGQHVPDIAPWNAQDDQALATLAIARRDHLGGQPLTDQHVRGSISGSLWMLAERYAIAVTTPPSTTGSTFLQDMRRIVARGRARGRGTSHSDGILSAPQVRGVLNYATAAVLRGLQDAEAAGVVPVLQGGGAVGTSPANDATPEPVASIDPTVLVAGRYTIVLNEDDDDYVTLRVKPHWQRDEAARGVMVVQYLRGPDNGRDYEGFATVRGQRLVPWQRFTRADGDSRILLAAELLIGCSAAGTLDDYRESFALRSGRCANCGRALTVPVSVHRGLGPDCARVLGVA